MRKYIVFAYGDYYPEGGLDDVKCDFDTLDQAFNYLKVEVVSGEEHTTPDHAHVVDRDTWKIVLRASKQ